MFRSAIAALAAPALALSFFAATAPPASATARHHAKPAAGIKFDYWIDATTTLKKLNQTVTVPRGTFSGTIDLATFKLKGKIALPPATSTIALAGIPAATATFAISEVKPVTGTVDLTTLEATATSVFNIKIVSVTPAGLPFVNLVGDSCQTSKPVRVTMTGALSPPLVFSGTYTIPPLANCGPLTPALNLVVPGPGNKFSATATAKS